MNLRFEGSEGSFQHFKLAMMNRVRVTASDTEADAVVYEVASLAALYKIPKKFSKPSYFYITTKDRDVQTKICDYPVSGLIFPPINANVVEAKLKNFSASYQARNPNEYDNIKIKILSKAENIPPLPSLAQQLITLTRSDSSTIADVTAKIKMDQGISTRVIKLINSPFYGVRGEISSIERAIVLLGFNSVKNIAAAISLSQYYSKPFHMYGTTGRAMWIHSYKTACISQLLAKEVGLDPDAFYLGGLLHDVGKVLAADFLVKETACPADEREQLGFDHAEIGSVLLRKWSVSAPVAEAVKNHHTTGGTAGDKVLYYANKMDTDTETAASLIDEMVLTVGLSDPERVQNKILPFIADFNVDV